MRTLQVILGCLTLATILPSLACSSSQKLKSATHQELDANQKALSQKAMSRFQYQAKPINPYCLRELPVDLASCNAPDQTKVSVSRGVERWSGDYVFASYPEQKGEDYYSVIAELKDSRFLVDHGRRWGETEYYGLEVIYFDGQTIKGANELSQFARMPVEVLELTQVRQSVADFSVGKSLRDWLKLTEAGRSLVSEEGLKLNLDYTAGIGLYKVALNSSQDSPLEARLAGIVLYSNQEVSQSDQDKCWSSIADGASERFPAAVSRGKEFLWGRPVFNQKEIGELIESFRVDCL
ncbi:MAG: hypothetical protein HRT45_10205 [Bdellovibrionales bacterium]|nr:hypothetical protein [Bdellovibrionales bacterium]